jgi:hypothetical protein
MILKKQKILFIHIKKTGGTSVEKVFQEKFPDISIKSKNHLVMTDYISKLGEPEIDKYYSFTIIRNPWDRITSLYFMRRGKRGNPSHFQKWVLRLDKHRYVQQKHLTYRHQYDWLSNKEGKLKVKEIIYFEKLKKGWDKVCKDLGFKKFSLPHKNKSRNSRINFNYSSMYKLPNGKWNDKAIERVRFFNHKDCSHFGYDFPY